jgi:hypothetical protein
MSVNSIKNGISFKISYSNGGGGVGERSLMYFPTPSKLYNVYKSVLKSQFEAVYTVHQQPSLHLQCVCRLHGEIK